MKTLRKITQTGSETCKKHLVIFCYILSNTPHALLNREVWGNGEGGGGRGALGRVFYGRLRPEVQTLSLLYAILIEKVPLSYTFHRKLYPFHTPTERLLLNVSLEKPLKILGWISRYVRLFESPLLPQWQFSQPLSMLQLVKSLPFYTTTSFDIPPAWKGYPFRAEPPRIVHYRKCHYRKCPPCHFIR